MELEILTKAADPIDTLIDQVPIDPVNNSSGILSMALNWLAYAADQCPPHWSRSRDAWLSALWQKVDPLKVAVKTFNDKATTIPFTIVPRDRSIRSHILQAEQLQNDILNQSGFFTGFTEQFSKAVTDYCTTDNGGFLLVMGNTDRDGRIIGSPSGVLHLDSMRCWRLSDPKFPVVYQDLDGSYYKFHYTRIIRFSHLPSPRADLNGVGFCPISCCVTSAQQQRNLANFSEEKLGSRPARQIIYVKKGATIDQIASAIKIGQQKMDSEGLETFAKTLLLAPKSANGELELGTLALNSVPDGFNRLEVTMSDMAFITAGFGLDLQDVNFTFGSVAAASSVDVQERKGRGKGVGSLLELLAREFTRKICPPQLFWDFDQNDDEQDEQQANIWNTRSQARERDLRSGATTVRAERERMLELGEISQAIFNTMELGDGRLPDGSDVILLFYTTDPYQASLLTMPVPQPDNIAANDPSLMLDAIQTQISITWRAMESARTSTLLFKSRCCMAALEKLRSLYEGALDAQLAAEQAAIDALYTANTADNARQSDTLNNPLLTPPTANPPSATTTIKPTPALAAHDQGATNGATH